MAELSPTPMHLPFDVAQRVLRLLVPAELCVDFQPLTYAAFVQAREQASRARTRKKPPTQHMFRPQPAAATAVTYASISQVWRAAAKDLLWTISFRLEGLDSFSLSRAPAQRLRLRLEERLLAESAQELGAFLEGRRHMLQFCLPDSKQRRVISALTSFGLGGRTPFNALTLICPSPRRLALPLQPSPLLGSISIVSKAQAAAVATGPFFRPQGSEWSSARLVEDVCALLVCAPNLISLDLSGVVLWPPFVDATSLFGQAIALLTSLQHLVLRGRPGQVYETLCPSSLLKLHLLSFSVGERLRSARLTHVALQRCHEQSADLSDCPELLRLDIQLDGGGGAAGATRFGDLTRCTALSKLEPERVPAPCPALHIPPSVRAVTLHACLQHTEFGALCEQLLHVSSLSLALCKSCTSHLCTDYVSAAQWERLIRLSRLRELHLDIRLPSIRGRRGDHQESLKGLRGVQQSLARRGVRCTLQDDLPGIPDPRFRLLESDAYYEVFEYL